MVDIGAGTTDVAMFWLQKNQVEAKAWYYAAGSRRIGMDNIDSALRSLFGSTCKNQRQAREMMTESLLLKHGDLAAPVLSTMVRHYAGVLERARQVDQRNTAWQSNGRAKFQLFLVGGGSKFRPAVEQFRKNPGMAGCKEWMEEPRQLAVPTSSLVRLADRRSVSLKDAGETAIAPLLILAYGLSHPRPDIPEYARDKDGVRKPEVVVKSFTPAELYGHS
ncbi:MAG: hypothetical protein NTV94_04190 [Planctomycetota bacterium]|nr:hypothetical protein [Planctomycetota bacterium]